MLILPRSCSVSCRRRHGVFAVLLASFSAYLSTEISRAESSDTAPGSRSSTVETWPQFRGPRGDGLAPNASVPHRWSESSHVRWKTPIHGRGWSSPVVLGDQLWLTTATEDGKQMFGVCVERKTGRIVHDLKVREVEEPRFCHALNSYASPTPAVEAGRVYLHFGSYLTTCLDTATGATLWRRTDLPCDHFRGPGSSPILFENLLIVHFDGADHQYVVAFDKRTGDTAWKTDRSNDFGGTTNGDFKKAYSTPIIVTIGGKLQLVSAGSRAAMGYDPRSGDELWQVRFSSFSSTGMPMFGHDRVFINTGFSKANLVSVRTGGTGDITETHVDWTYRHGVPSKPSTLLVGDEIFMIHDDGIASCVDAKSGERVWRERLEGKFSASPVYAGGVILAPNHEGKTFVFRASRTYEPVAVNELDDGCMASPAVIANELYLRTKTHLYRIEK